MIRSQVAWAKRVLQPPTALPIVGFQPSHTVHRRWFHQSRRVLKVWSPLRSEEILKGLERSRDEDDYASPLLSLDMCQEYSELSPADKEETLRAMATEVGVKPQSFRPLLSALCEPRALVSSDGVDPVAARAELAQLRKLKRQLIPLYESLFRHLINLPKGLKFIVDMRADLLRVLRSKDSTLSPLDHARLKYLDQELKFLLGNWFHIGLLELKRLLWSDSAELLEKVAQYEAVHPIANVSDLKQRVGGGRRLFAFFHPVMPDEPVVMVNVALTLDGILHNISDILRIPSEQAQLVEDSLLADPSARGTAMFYSITSPHRVNPLT